MIMNRSIEEEIADEQAIFTDMKRYETERSGYNRTSSIWPRSVGLTLADTPVSFATSIYALFGRERQRR